ANSAPTSAGARPSPEQQAPSRQASRPPGARQERGAATAPRWGPPPSPVRPRPLAATTHAPYTRARPVTHSKVAHALVDRPGRRAVLVRSPARLGEGATEHRRHPRRRPGGARPRLHRQHLPRDAAPRPPGQTRDAVHKRLRLLPRLLADAGGADD